MVVAHFLYNCEKLYALHLIAIKFSDNPFTFGYINKRGGENSG